jgi:hypothetical protein
MSQNDSVEMMWRKVYCANTFDCHYLASLHVLIATIQVLVARQTLSQQSNSFQRDPHTEVYISSNHLWR